MITICTTLIGLGINNSVKEKIIICRQLIEFSKLLLVDYNSKLTPIIELTSKLLNSQRFDKLDFIRVQNIIEQGEINSPLTKEENCVISSFLCSLGKSPVESQMTLIKSFIVQIEDFESKYDEIYNKYKKIYLSIGFFSGLVISIVLA